MLQLYIFSTQYKNITVIKAQNLYFRILRSKMVAFRFQKADFLPVYIEFGRSYEHS